MGKKPFRSVSYFKVWKHIQLICSSLHLNQDKFIHGFELQYEVNQEIDLGKIMGPFQKFPLAILHISPVGVEPKSDGEWRMIIHLSYPEFKSINYVKDPELCSVFHSSFNNFVEMVASLRKGPCLMN